MKSRLARGAVLSALLFLAAFVVYRVVAYNSPEERKARWKRDVERDLQVMGFVLDSLKDLHINCRDSIKLLLRAERSPFDRIVRKPILDSNGFATAIFGDPSCRDIIPSIYRCKRAPFCESGESEARRDRIMDSLRRVNSKCLYVYKYDSIHADASSYLSIRESFKASRICDSVFSSVVIKRKEVGGEFTILNLYRKFGYDCGKIVLYFESTRRPERIPMVCR
jgi:hypothetical protein